MTLLNYILLILLFLYHKSPRIHSRSNNFENIYNYYVDDDDDDGDNDNGDNANVENHKMDKNKNGQPFPYIVSIHLKGNHYCGGSLISSNFVLTAAHCLIIQDINSRRLRRLKPDAYKVVVGEHDLSKNLSGNYVDVIKTYMHPFYNNRILMNDIGLMELKFPCKEQEFIKLANSKQITNSLRSFRETLCIIAGWGAFVPVAGPNDHIPEEKSFTPYLQSAEIPLITNANCKKHYSTYQFNNNIQLCTFKQGVDPCKGDSGGPLICNDKQYGIISYGHGCAQNYPSVYARVDVYQKWITEISGVSGINQLNKLNYLALLNCILITLF